MTTRDLSAFFDDGSLTYPGIPSSKHPDGKTYTVPSPDAKTGLFLNHLADAGMTTAAGGEATDAKLKLDDAEERDFHEMVLGPVFREMIDDGVKWTLVQHVSRDAFLSFSINTEFADALLDMQGKELARANRADKRAAAKTAKKAPAKKAAAKKTTRSTASGRPGSATPTSRARTPQAKAG